MTIYDFESEVPVPRTSYVARWKVEKQRIQWLRQLYTCTFSPQLGKKIGERWKVWKCKLAFFSGVNDISSFPPPRFSLSRVIHRTQNHFFLVVYCLFVYKLKLKTISQYRKRKWLNLTEERCGHFVTTIPSINRTRRSIDLKIATPTVLFPRKGSLSLFVLSA